MATVSVAKEEKKWREESDVRTLAEAEKIKTDKRRFSAAQRRAKAMAAEAMKEASAVQNVAAGKVGGKAPAKKKGGGAKRRVSRKKK